MKTTRFAQESAAQANDEAQYKQAQHTPGPWQAGLNIPQAANNSPDVRIVWAGSLAVCDCRSNWTDVVAAAANARLIAAAPELLEAAQKAQNAIQRVAGINDENRLGWALQALDAAIAKAIGK